MQITARVVLCMLVSCCVLPSLGFAEVSTSTARTINETVKLAIFSHPKIHAELKAYRAEYSRLTEVESGFLPKVSLGLGIGRERSNNTLTRAVTNSGTKTLQRKETSITLNQMLFDGFKTHWQRKGQLKVIEAQQAALRNLMSETALKAINSHLLVAMDNKILSFNIANLTAHQTISKEIEVRVRSGKDDYAKVSQVSARLSLSLANVEAARNKVFKVSADYSRDVGQAPSKKLYFQNKLFKLPNNKMEFLNNAMHANLLLASQMEKKEASVAIAKAANNTDYPSLFLQSGATWNNNLDGIVGRNNDAFIMLRMNYDLFKGGADKAAKKYASLLSQKANYELDDARRVIRRDAAQAWFDYQSGTKRVAYLQDYVESARNTLKAYNKQFNIGQRTLIDLLDAENELLRAKRTMVEAQKELYLSKYQILNLNGTLLSTLSFDETGLIDE